MKIKSFSRTYEVDFSETIANAESAWLDNRDKIFCVDRNVAPAFRDAFANEAVYFLTATEDEKTLQGVERLLTWMQENKVHRGSTLIAIGGGITQDIAAFAAHTYFRGIDWWFLPTTLLSQADSCIGSKYGVNLAGRKNQVGNYNPPARVYICSEFLKSLTSRDLMSGYGEIFRLMWTKSEQDFAQLAVDWESGEALGSRLLTTIQRGLEIKKEVIEVDEYEKDLRRILNYGHTFGHALEVLTDHRIPHGLAVVWGMDLIDDLSMQMGLLPEKLLATKRKLSQKIFGRAFTEIEGVKGLIDGLRPEDLLSVIRLDKKSSRGQIRLVLNAGPGDLRVVPVEIDERLRSMVGRALR